MSVRYYLTPFRPPIWDGVADVHIQPIEYARKLQQDWNARIVAQSETQLSWDLLKDDVVVLDGHVDASMKIISISGTTKSISEFVLWHKHIVSKDSPLYLFDEGLHIIIEVNNDSTPETIGKEIESW